MYYLLAQVLVPGVQWQMKEIRTLQQKYCLLLLVVLPQRQLRGKQNLGYAPLSEWGLHLDL